LPDFLRVTKTFKLPVNADLLYLLTHGSRSYGALDVRASEDPSQEDVLFQVDATYNHQKLIEHSKVCLLRRSDGERGLGIFVRAVWTFEMHC
jgi:hypothetical protein